MHGRAEEIAGHAGRHGFSLAGVTPLGAVPRGEFVARWLAEGRAGEMRYLEERVAKRLDPRLLAPWARALVTLAWAYPAAPGPASDWRTALRGRVAAYARGPDYHHRVRTHLQALARDLGRAFPGHRFRPTIDTGAVLEREWATRAGLGWTGRNTLVLDRAQGSYFFLAELFTDLELHGPPTPVADHCGSCTRCVAACPTGALAGDYSMDPRRCISYLTIEHRSAIPLEFRPLVENWIFGCDLCQDVCPWNREATASADGDILHPELLPLLALDAAAFRARFAGSVIARTGRDGLVRNVAVALGNSCNRDAVPGLRGALADRSPLVRAHVAWALGRLGGTAAQRALERAAPTEPEASVQAEISAARAQA